MTLPSIPLPVIQVASLATTGPPRPSAATAPLPMTRGEMLARGWQEVDVVFVSGDA